MIKIEPLKNRLTLLNYSIKETHHQQGEVVLNVYLPLLCYLKIRFTERKVKISSRTYISSDLIPLEINFLIYSLGLLLLLAFEAFEAYSIYTVFFVVFLLFFLMCMIKLEFLKLIIIRWIEKELNSK